ncbi:nucleotidyltransferase family protein [Gammaproteobacteria bacterium]|nr:nucleotidyltransferase family protein [Gammaproteobacteria bacterium]
MDALILAAGVGKRMLPVTKTTPKPLLTIGKTSLIEEQIDKLVAAGIQHIVITLHHLGEQIFNKIGNGKRWNITIEYSWEPQLLNTGSGVMNALPKISSQQFLLVNSDIYTDYPYAQLLNVKLSGHGQLVLVPNHANMHADFGLNNKLVTHASSNQKSYTFSGIMQYTEKNLSKHSQSLKTILDKAISNKELFGEIYTGYWCDAGTHSNYEMLQRLLQK